MADLLANNIKDSNNGVASSVPALLGRLVTDAISTPPKTPRGKATYEALLKAAEHEFVLADYHAVSVEIIAARSNASVGSIYRYFGSKEGIFLVVLANCLGEMYEAARRVGSVSSSYYERLEISTEGYLKAYWHHRQVLRSAAYLQMTSPRVRQMSWAMRQLVHRAMADRLAMDQQDRNLSQLDPETLTRALTAMVDGYAQRAYIDGEYGGVDTAKQDMKHAAKVLSTVWYRAVFGSEAPN